MLLERMEMSPNTAVFRFALPKGEALGMPACSHLSLRAPDPDRPGKLVVRSYTPVSGPQERGFFDLLIKRYPGGKMTGVLFAMRPGQRVEAKGPQAAKLKCVQR